MKQKVLVILGPTATGKSNLAIKIAKKYKGEVISADSRQVYKGLDIGTGKITKKEMGGIPHHMLNIISPKKTFTVVDWKKQTEKIIIDILKRDKLPIICGGTGFYIQSIVDGIVLPQVPPNPHLRKNLEKKNLSWLQKTLKKLDLKRFKDIDVRNKVRLIRAIEIAEFLGSVPKVIKQKVPYQILQIGLPPENLKHRIHIRLLARIKNGMISEAKKLHEHGLSWRRMRELGLEYRYLADYLEKILTKKEFLQRLEREIYHYSKRQMTWFKKDKRIKWFNPRKTREIKKKIIKLLA
ncbi:MAG: tRNA (adenosine(37)-N6)-dimethylallyltransferase MiaA [Minisyncoccia bacterium]